MINSDVIGNLGSDAELRELNGKKCVCFNAASSDVRISSTNPEEKVTVTTWVRVFWYGTGGKVFERLKKGSKVFVRGRVQVSAYNDRSNIPQVSYNLFANEVLSLSDFAKSENSQE